MSEPRWLTKSQIVRIHAEQLAIFGGPAGVRDEGLLASAIDRARNKWAYGETDLGVLAASYAFGLSRNHPFLDGNKRAAFMAMMVFLHKNDIIYEVVEVEASAAMLALAAGEVDEDGLARWITDNWPGERG